MPRETIEGMAALEKTVKRLGQLPQKCVTTAARKGAMIAKKAAKRGGWIDQSGAMRRGIVLKGEKASLKGKKVYQVTMDKNMNDTFVKMVGDKRYYYPSSQEYGFQTRSGGYIPGFHFLRDSIEENGNRIEKEIVGVLSKEIDKLK